MASELRQSAVSDLLDRLIADPNDPRWGLIGEVLAGLEPTDRAERELVFLIDAEEMGLEQARRQPHGEDYEEEHA